MSVKEEVLNQLLKNCGKSLSGEELANCLNVSRTAIWKAVKTLKKEGYKVEAVTNKGYCLQKDDELFTAQNVLSFLPENVYDIKIEKKVTSTNDIAKTLAQKGAKEWTVILANEQTAGRGRYGRKFFSPQDTGVYCSVILRPKYKANETLFITTSAAVAICEAIEQLTGKKTQIKWVNDIFIEGKKVCGILTEASLSVENGGLDFAVLGFGINLKTEKFPDELKDIATSLFDNKYKGDARAKLTALILEKFNYYYQKISEKAFYNAYKQRSFVIGKQVHVVSGNIDEYATVLDIDENCFLKLRFASGEEKTLSSGEISIKL